MMMLQVEARERTEGHWRELLADMGLTDLRCYQPPAASASEGVIVVKKESRYIMEYVLLIFARKSCRAGANTADAETFPFYSTPLYYGPCRSRSRSSLDVI
ncbi:hypothetical protein BJX65DRAFT_194435 [Aspergillus insuetus]